MKVVANFCFLRSTVTAGAFLAAAGCQGMREGVQPQTPSDMAPRLTGIPAHRSPLRVLHAFDPGRGNHDGGTPIARLIESGGKFYGTTWTGGALHSWGTVFEVDSAGRKRTVYVFRGGYTYMDGGNPYSGLTSMGNVMYGTTFKGGAYNNSGTVFSITPTGTETVIHSFGANGDGYQPAGDLLAYNGSLYGTTSQGGNGRHCRLYCGAVFAITPSGSERIIHRFRGHDGARPYAGVIEVHGILYGTTTGGGGGGGTVYSLSPSGMFKRLHAFGKHGDGAYPYGTLLFAHGSLYGTTSAGGAQGDGTIFKLGLDGSETVLYSFKSYLDGAKPEGGLILVNDKLVGTTSQGGGGCGCGTIFSVDLSGKETTLHLLDGIHDGENPQDTLLYSNGALFGTAYTGGAYQFGTVFRLRLL